MNVDSAPSAPNDAEEPFFEILLALAERWKLLLFVPLACGCIALGVTFLLTPMYTARTALLPPQQNNGAGSALASLGALANFAGAGSAILRTPADQYVALMQSTTVMDALINRFGLTQVYDKPLRSEVRLTFAEHSRVNLNKRTGIITVEVDDRSPQRAADITNAYVEELRRLTDGLALTEAQQRRAFFEGQMQQARDRMTQAQQALQGSGVGDAALRAEPRAALESYTRLKAEVRAAEVMLQSLRGSLTSLSPEVRQQELGLAALRSQLAAVERSADAAEPNRSDYVSRLRDFKYHEALFELLARQFESAKVDEAREGALIQVIDKAEVPDRKSSPKRAVTALVTTAVAAVLVLAWVLVARGFGRNRAGGTTPTPSARLVAALSGRRQR